MSADTRDALGRTELHRAIADKDVEAVRSLLEQGADWEIADHQGWWPTDAMYTERREPWGILFELKRGYKPILALLQQAVLERPLCSLTFLNRGDLFGAILEGRVSAVQDALDDAGVWDVNIRLQDGTTPLHLAVEGGNARVVAALLDHTKVLDVRGRTRTYLGPRPRAPQRGRRDAAGHRPPAGGPEDPRPAGSVRRARGPAAPSSEAPDSDPDAVDAQVIATTRAILEQARDLEGCRCRCPA
ncbi:MAG: hypothetical protein H6738_18735 [Alphaproteobacteria bacterium]|nr:hypothetical protein [Alphaproteobacteria bacterium]